MEKEDIIKKFSLSFEQVKNIELFISTLKETNIHTNLVGRSTIENIWKNHILDSLQILPLLSKRNCSLLDMGTGAGFPGILFAMLGFKHVTLIDSNNKKINFLKKIKKKLSLSAFIKLGRIENFNNVKFDVITSRALANLNKLFSYSQKFLKKNTVLIFLKGKTVNEEIKEAEKKWKFKVLKKQSISDSRGTILIITELRKND